MYKEKKEYMGGKFGELTEINILDYFVKNKKLLQVYFRDSGRLWNKKKDITVYMDFVVRLLNKHCGKLIKKDNNKIKFNGESTYAYIFRYNTRHDEMQDFTKIKTSVITSGGGKLLKEIKKNVSSEEFSTTKINVVEQNSNTHDEMQDFTKIKTSVITSGCQKVGKNIYKKSLKAKDLTKKIKVIDLEDSKASAPKNSKKNKNTPKMQKIKELKKQKSEAKKEYNSLDSMMEWWVASIINNDKIEYDTDTIPLKLKEYLTEYSPQAQWGEYTGITGNLRENLIKYLTEAKEEKMKQEDLEENIFS